MHNPCGTTRAYLLAETKVGEIPVYWGTGVNPVNSPAQFFVAWGEGVLAGGLIHTFNCQQTDRGFLWFSDEDEAEAKYQSIQRELLEKPLNTKGIY